MSIDAGESRLSLTLCVRYRSTSMTVISESRCTAADGAQAARGSPPGRPRATRQRYCDTSVRRSDECRLLLGSGLFTRLGRGGWSPDAQLDLGENPTEPPISFLSRSVVGKRQVAAPTFGVKAQREPPTLVAQLSLYDDALLAGATGPATHATPPRHPSPAHRARPPDSRTGTWPSHSPRRTRCPTPARHSGGTSLSTRARSQGTERCCPRPGGSLADRPAGRRLPGAHEVTSSRARRPGGSAPRAPLLIWGL